MVAISFDDERIALAGRDQMLVEIELRSFALAPLALGLGTGSQLQQPLAIAVIGGFILSGPIVLFLLSALYQWIDPNGRLAGNPETI